MPNKTHTTFLHQFLRALEPTVTSALVCLVVGALIAVSQLLYISVQFGTILPEVLDGRFATAYTNYVVGPISRVIHAQSTTNLLSIALWGLGGLLLYEVCSFVFREISEWHNASTKQSFSQSQTSVRRNLLGQRALRLVFRACLAGVAVASLSIIRPILDSIYTSEFHITSNTPLAQQLAGMAIVVVIWAFLLHYCLVLVRLFLFRTRLLEDEEVYS